MTKPLADRNDFVLLLGGLAALAAMTIDITAPATAVIARDFAVPEKLGAMIVGVYFVAYAIGQLFWGLLSDAYGRRKVLLISLGAFALASLGAALASSFEMLIVFRALQGLTAGAPVIARAIVRDIGSGVTVAKILAVLMAVTAIAPMLAPIIGSGLLVLFSWQAIFVFLAGLSVVLFAMSFQNIPETAKETRPDRFSITFIIYAFKYLFKQRDFLVGMGVSSLVFGGYASILSLGAVVVEEAYGLSPSAFASLFAIGALFIFAGSMLLRFLVPRWGMQKIGTFAISIMGLATLIHIVLFFTTPSLTVFWGGACIYMLAFGVILPSSQALAMEPAAEMPGFAGSVLGSMLMVAGGFGAALAAILFDGSHSAISGAMAVFGGLSIACFIAARLYDRAKLNKG